MAGEWTDERRQKARERALKNKPWRHSTGPKTPEGKAKASLNALDHGLRSEYAKPFLELLAINKETLTLHLHFTKLYYALKERGALGDHHTNELICRLNKNKGLKG